MKTQKKLPYIIVAIAACLMACGVMGLPNAYGIFYSPIAQNLGVGRGDATMHISFSSLSAGFTAPMVAAMIRRRGKVRPFILSGALLLFCTGMGIAFSKNVLFVDAMGPFRGFGMTLAGSMIITMIIGNWFEKFRGTLTGIALSFSGVGSAIATPILSSCLTRFGFRPTYIGFVCTMALMILPAVFLCPLTPQEVGLEPYGIHEKKKEKEVKQTSYLDLPFRLNAPVFICLVVLIFLIVSLTSLNAHLSSFASTYGYSAAIGATLMSVSMIGNVAAKFALGVITDKIGVYKGVTLMLALTLAGIAVMLLSGGSVFLLYAGGFMFGTSFSLGSLGASMLTRHLFGNAQYSKAYSYVTMSVYLASAITVTLIGYMYDLSGSYQTTMVVWCGIALASILLLLAIVKMAASQAARKG